MKILFIFVCTVLRLVGTAWNPHIAVTYCIYNCDLEQNQKPNRKPKKNIPVKIPLLNTKFQIPTNIGGQFWFLNFFFYLCRKKITDLRRKSEKKKGVYKWFRIRSGR